MLNVFSYLTSSNIPLNSLASLVGTSSLSLIRKPERCVLNLVTKPVSIIVYVYIGLSTSLYDKKHVAALNHSNWLYENLTGIRSQCPFSDFWIITLLMWLFVDIFTEKLAKNCIFVYRELNWTDWVSCLSLLYFNRLRFDMTNNVLYITSMLTPRYREMPRIIDALIKLCYLIDVLS